MNYYRLSLIFLTLSGCSNQQIYDGIQRGNQFDCYKLPLAQQDDCIEDTRSISYEEYKRERDKTLTDSNVK